MMNSQPPPRISPARLALAARKLRSEREDLALLNSDPIAVIGMACRFPARSNSPEEYWAALMEGRTGIVEMSEHRWQDCGDLEPLHRLGGYLDAIDGFDAEYFGIAPREAKQIDPQQRLLLEVVWEALWDAGIEPAGLSGTAAGVFASIYNSDYARLHFSDRTALGAYAGIGTAHSVAAGRLSYLLNIKGPSLAVDTACSSSLVATHLAVQSLRSGECSLAVVGASSLKVLPDEVLVFSKWGMLAQDGKCKTFDASADGFVPGEGCGAVILKRLSEALQDGDRIRAVIRGTAVNHDGRTTVLTAPNGLAQQAVIQSALQNAQIDVADVSYIETHGTGTSLGDPIEVEALQTIYGAANGNTDPHPCVLGAVKTNLGHLEAAAGLAGIIKTVLCLENGAIPRNLHFHTLNPQISLDGSRLVIPTETTAWPRAARPRVAGISGFGLGGTNAHVIVEEAPEIPAGRVRTPIAKRLWKREHYWLPGVSKVRATASVEQDPILHPLVGRRIHSGFVQGRLFETILSTASITYLRDHRIGDRPLLPFAGFLEMVYAAGRESIGDEPFVIKAFTLAEPLFLEAKKRVQTLVSGDQVEIASERDPIWTKHARGVFHKIGNSAPAVDLSSLRARCSEVVEPSEVYRRLESTGLRYGPLFRGVVSVSRGSGESLARLRVPEELQSEIADYALHPVLLDACLQTVIVAMSEFSGDRILPVAADEFQLSQSGMSEVWAHVVLRSTGPDRVVTDISIFDSEGESVALLRGFQAKRITAASINSLGLKQAPAYQLLWRAETPLPSLKTTQNSRRWLLVESARGSSAELAVRLAEEGAQTLVAQLNDLLPGLDASGYTDILLRLSKNAAINGDKEWEFPEESVVKFLLNFARSLRSQQKAPRLWVVASHIAMVVPGEEISPDRAPLFGLLRTLACEHPATAPVLIDADDQDDQGMTNSIMGEIMADGPEPLVAIRHNIRHVARLAPASPVTSKVQQLVSNLPGVIDALQWEPSERQSPESGEIEIEIRTHGLNFRDVLNSLGVFNIERPRFGAECAGVVTRVGSNVSSLKPGDCVLAFAPYSMQSYAIVPEAYAAIMPRRMTFAQAATIPVAFLTAQYGFKLARLSRGQRVLIHAASGGLGLAAVQLAQRVGAEIYSTAGSEHKREFLHRLGIRHVFDSRSATFLEYVMNATGGAGVNVVLNSLSGELIKAGLETLAPDGCFLEVGKRDIWTAEEVRKLRADLRYYAFDLGEVAKEDPELIRVMLNELVPDFAAERLQPLQVQVYPVEETSTAFRTMAQAAHIGKIVLSRSAEGESDSETLQTILERGTVLVAGGLGALGRVTASWLVKKGARRLVLTGRTPSDDGTFVASLQEGGAEVLIEQMDVANPENVERVLLGIRNSGVPLTAVFHIAGVVHDRVLEGEVWNTYRQAVAAKIEGAWNLHRLTEIDPVKLMVFFSSAAGILGSPGQGSYAAANTFLDSLAHYRASRGLATLSVDWGAWADTGMAARLAPEHAERLLRQGVNSLEAAAALRTMEKAIAERRTQVAVLDVAWDRFFEHRLAKDRALFTELCAYRPESPRDEKAKPIRTTFSNTLVQDRKAVISAHVRDCARRAMSLPGGASVPDDVPLQELGLDSLMAIDMKNELAQSMDLPLAAGLLFNYPTVRELTTHLIGLLPGDVSMGTLTHVVEEDALAQISEEEAERLLLEELEHLGDGSNHA